MKKFLAVILLGLMLGFMFGGEKGVAQAEVDGDQGGGESAVIGGGDFGGGVETEGGSLTTPDPQDVAWWVVGAAAQTGMLFCMIICGSYTGGMGGQFQMMGPEAQGHGEGETFGERGVSREPRDGDQR